MAYLMGIDVGTTGTKTILIEETGKIASSNVQEYPLHTPRPNWAEQNPGDWWKARVESVNKALSDSKIKAEDVKGIGLSGQMQADIMNLEMATLNITQGAAFGAAILAGVGTGAYDSVEGARDDLILTTSRTKPIRENVKVYHEYYEIYRSLYPALAQNFDRIGELITG